KIVNSAGKNYRNGEADVTFSGPDVQTVLKKTLDYSGDDWGVTINLPGQNNDDFSQLVFMFEPGQGRIRRVSLIRDNISNGKRIIELTCSGS
ncbi:MAG TPA: hypothetical protein VN516_06735, partial [Candidatus Baltobacteraceae bacterium]|nr:hypothetical protein [Candidatus Baltobacteraceae bacterium]